MFRLEFETLGATLDVSRLLLVPSIMDDVMTELIANDHGEIKDVSGDVIGSWSLTASTLEEEKRDA